MFISEPYVWRMIANTHLFGGIAIKEVSKGILYIKEELQDPGSWANV